jgi:HSP20 family protein
MIRGERMDERKEGDEGRYHLVERSYGSFSRSFQLPQGVDDESIDAHFENGLLRVRVPKAAIPQPRRISIQGATTGDRSQAQISGTTRGGNGGSRKSASSEQKQRGEHAEEKQRGEQTAQKQRGEMAGADTR